MYSKKGIGNMGVLDGFGCILNRGHLLLVVGQGGLRITSPPFSRSQFFMGAGKRARKKVSNKVQVDDHIELTSKKLRLGWMLVGLKLLS